MEMSRTETYRRLLESIAMYSQKMLNLFGHGAGDLPQWANDLISESRTHIADVTHFLRGQANHGIRYGQSNHGRAYMATANLRQIHQYANECLGDMKKDAGHLPAWVENKISVVAEYMDLNNLKNKEDYTQCGKAMIKFYQIILAEDDKTSANILRYIFTQSQN